MSNQRNSPAKSTQRPPFATSWYRNGCTSFHYVICSKQGSLSQLMNKNREDNVKTKSMVLFKTRIEDQGGSGRRQRSMRKSEKVVQCLRQAVANLGMHETKVFFFFRIYQTASFYTTCDRIPSQVTSSWWDRLTKTKPPCGAQLLPLRTPRCPAPGPSTRPPSTASSCTSWAAGMATCPCETFGATTLVSGSGATPINLPSCQSQIRFFVLARE